MWKDLLNTDKGNNIKKKKIDFYNGDVMDFLKYIGKGIGKIFESKQYKF